MPDPTISEKRRDSFIAKETCFSGYMRRIGRAVPRKMAANLARWFRLGHGGLTVLQAGYLLAVAASVCIAVWFTWKEGFATEAKFVVWVQMGCTGFITLYKITSESIAGSTSTHEIERREYFAQLLNRLLQARAVADSRIEEADRRQLLNGLCVCIRRDLEERLQLREENVYVTLIGYSAHGDNVLDGQLSLLARDRARANSFLDQCKSAATALASEAIRQGDGGQTVLFHDVQEALFRSTLGTYHRNEDRTLIFMPLKAVGGGPFAILGIAINRPYVLWPFKADAWERRLAPYIYAAIMLCKGGAP